MKLPLITLAVFLGASGAACAQQPVSTADSTTQAAPAPVTAAPVAPRKPFEEQQLDPAEREARARSRHAQEQQMQELALNPNHHPRKHAASTSGADKSGKSKRRK